MSSVKKEVTSMLDDSTRIALLEQTNCNVKETLMQVEKRLEQRFDLIETKIDKVDQKMWQIAVLIIGSIMTLVITKLFHL